MLHLMIDFENIRPENLNTVPIENTHIWLYMGATQKNLPIELVQSLLRFGERVHLIKLEKTGKNALDFYLSYYLGQITAIDKDAHIAILSHDGGYDILVEHILANQLAQNIQRISHLNIPNINTQAIATSTHADLSQSQLNKPISEVPLKPFIQLTLATLRQKDVFLPRYLNNLKNNLRKYVLHDLLAGQDEDKQIKIVESVINRLIQQKFLEVSENIVHYHISDQDMLRKIQAYILQHKPKTTETFYQALQQRTEALALSFNNNDARLFLDHLIQKHLIYETDGILTYSPSIKGDNITENHASKITQQNAQEIYEQICIALQRPNRPKKISSLNHLIQAHCKEFISNSYILNRLKSEQWIRIEDNKLIYLK